MPKGRQAVRLNLKAILGMVLLLPLAALAVRMAASPHRWTDSYLALILGTVTVSGILRRATFSETESKRLG